MATQKIKNKNQCHSTASISSLCHSTASAARPENPVNNDFIVFMVSPIKSGNDREKGLSPSDTLLLSSSDTPSLSPSGLTGGPIKYYCRLFTLVCGILITSTIALAEDTTTETCANGGGTVITGAVTGHKYCKSNNTMNWWNAVAWCDAQGRRLFDRSDCACSNTTADCRSKCPELVVGVGKEVWVWTATFYNSFIAYLVRLSFGNVTHAQLRGANGYGGYYALCY